MAVILILTVAACASVQAQSAFDVETLNNRAVALYGEGKYAEAIPFAERALTLARSVYGEEYRVTLRAANNLALLYQNVGRYSEAEPLLKRALERYVEALGAVHPDTLLCANNLALLYVAQGRYG